ncbi:MAG: divergent polysaccharide deacetylase family protein [Synergistaceae bacterium]|jgi:polysaccharide deacetylase 2 family uncharacterized protein YibQ|nr:divergent polysaccharide deacetylase family protein [Synergistaceae bacterium]
MLIRWLVVFLAGVVVGFLIASWVMRSTDHGDDSGTSRILSSNDVLSSRDAEELRAAVLNEIFPPSDAVIEASKDVLSSPDQGEVSADVAEGILPSSDIGAVQSDVPQPDTSGIIGTKISGGLQPSSDDSVLRIETSKDIRPSPNEGSVTANVPKWRIAPAKTQDTASDDDYRDWGNDETLLSVSLDVVYDVVEAEGSSDAAPGGDSGRIPMLAIVLDDVGYSMSLAMQVISMDLPLTMAVIPGTRHSAAIAAELDRRDIPYLAHIPMQAAGDPDGKAGHIGLKDDYAIGVGMTESAIREILIPLIDSLPGAYGVSNHRGSKVTSDPETMKALMRLLKERNLFFLDSHTTANTVAYETARAMGVRTARNSFFIDHDGDVDKIWAAFDRAIGVVTKAGSAVAICHMRLETIKFLEGLKQRDLNSDGVRLVTLTQLMKERELRKGEM